MKSRKSLSLSDAFLFFKAFLKDPCHVGAVYPSSPFLANAMTNLDDFKNLYLKSLEEFNLQDNYKNLVEVYNELKNAKTRYRVSLDDCHTEFSRCFSKTSLVLKTIN